MIDLSPYSVSKTKARRMAHLRRYHREMDDIFRMSMREIVAVSRKIPSATSRSQVDQLFNVIIKILADVKTWSFLVGYKHAKSQLPMFSASISDEIPPAAQAAGISPANVGAIGSGAADAAREAVSVVQDSVHAVLSAAIEQLTMDGIPLYSPEGQAAIRAALGSIGASSDSPAALATLARTEAQFSASLGQLQAIQDPVIKEMLWGYEYMTVGDSVVRPSHAAMEGVRLPVDDVFWVTSIPPNGWNCRCDIVLVFKDDPDAVAVNPAPVEIDGKTYEPIPDKGWDYNMMGLLPL